MPEKGVKAEGNLELSVSGLRLALAGLQRIGIKNIPRRGFHQINCREKCAGKVEESIGLLYRSRQEISFAGDE